MKDKNEKKNDAKDSPRKLGVGRRDLMKMGVGAGVAAMTQMLHVPKVLAQGAAGETGEPAPSVTGTNRGIVPGGPPYITPHTPQHRVAKYGDFMNKSGRLSGNGPMDETSRRIVSYASSFSVDLTDKLVADIGNMLEDTIGCAISAFETDSIRAGARMASWSPGGQLKSTVWGYGITTTPELAAFVGSCAVRHYDNNSSGMHETDMVPAIIAVGEALHSSGSEVLSAMVLFWEVFSALLAAKYAPGAPGDRGVDGNVDNHTHAAATAVAVSKLMGLNEDRMANALSLSFVDNIPLGVDHWEGPDSMSKSNHDAALARSGVFASLSARAGITGPAEPFEGPKGLMDVVTGRFDLKIPAKVINDSGGYPTVPNPPGDDRRVIQTIVYKRWPANGAGSGVFTTVPAFKKFCKIEDIESITMDVGSWGDGNGPGKMDPLNSETADHSTAYTFSRVMLDGELSPASYENDKLTDPKVRALMAKITQREERGGKITIRTKSGQEMTRIAGEKTPDNFGYQLGTTTIEEMHKKFDNNCAYRGVTNEQRDKIRDTWHDLRKVKDISVAVHDTLAHIGKTTAL